MKVNRNTLITFFAICFSLNVANAQTPKSATTPGEGVELNVYIPNAITPNSDGRNDIFKPIISGGEIDIYDLTIYDRTGRVIFHTNSPDRVWNGSLDGSSYAATPNLYVYILKLKSVQGIETKTYTGHIVTVR